MIKSIKIRLIPTQEQEELMLKSVGVARFTYNWGLSKWEEMYKKGLKPSKAKIKKEFNYQIPIAEVERAGISSTGSQIENELEPLAKEFKAYREKEKLWNTKIKSISYQITDEEIGRIRIVDGLVSDPEIFYK